MKKNHGRILLFVILCAAIVFCVTAFFFLRQRNAVHTVVRIEKGPNPIYEKTLLAAGDQDYDPYTFFDPQHVPSGHDVELFYILADKMAYNGEVALLPWDEALDAVEKGRADMALTVAYSPEEYPELDLSIPLVNDPFVAFGKTPFTQIGELYGRRLAVLEDTGCIPGFIVPYRLAGNTREFSSVSQVFASVQKGECDYAIVRYSVGRRAMANLADETIKAVGPTLLNNYVCIGVQAGREDLLEELNSAIISISSDGTLASLSDKWLGHYVDTLTFQEYLRANVNTLLYITGALLLLFLTAFLLISKSAAKKKETILKKLAERDQLTGLYNRSTCENMIRETLNSSDTDTAVHALLVIDMDNFKMINDTFGHMEGDAALVRLADGLSKLFRAGDVVGRLGGDEFFVFLSDCTSPDTATRKAVQVGSLFQNTYSINDITIHISASVGIAMYPAQGVTFSALYKSADDALYTAKRLGKGGYAMRDEKGEMVYRPYASCGGTSPNA